MTHAYSEGQPGKILIAAERVGENIVLEFKDDGKGIAEQDLNRIFDPFFTTKRGQGGSGLGLNIVYNLVKSSLNGNVEVESKLGYGTKFRMVFPMNVEGAQA
jgi:signal transduction histidine kinase